MSKKRIDLRNLFYTKDEVDTKTEVDDTLSSTSTKPLQNKSVFSALSTKIDTAGTGLSKSGTTLNHSNSVSAKTSSSLYKFKHDATGHITESTAVGIDTTSGGTSGSSNLITSGAVYSGLSGKASGSHAHGDITNDGAMTTSGVDKDTGDWPVVTDNSDGKKLKRGQIYTGFVWDNYARPNIGTAAQATQTAINAAIDTALGNKVDTTDSRLSDARNPKMTKIPRNSDLNNYTTAGFYYNDYNVDAETIANRPSYGVKAFYLQVEKWGNNNNVKQTISSYHHMPPSPLVYVRVKNGADTWSDWRQISTYNEPKFIDNETTLTSTGSGTDTLRLADGYFFQNKNNDWAITGEIKVTGSAARFELQLPTNTDANNHISIGKNTDGNFSCWWSTSASAESSHEDSTITFTNGTWYPFAILKRGNTITWKFNNTKHHQVLTTYVNGLTYLTPQLRKWTTSNISVRNVRIVPHKYNPLTDVATTIDLNDYKNDGDYLLWFANMSGTTNCPTTQGGLLTVETIPNGVKQTITEYYKDNPKIYYRIFHATAGWREWKEIINSDDTRLTNARTPTSHASTATTYGVSSASNYGHAMASSTSPKANGTAAVGSETAKFARGDHVHPHNCVNNLTSTSTTAPLAANQGKVLKDSLTWKTVSLTNMSGVSLQYNDLFCRVIVDGSYSINTANAYAKLVTGTIPTDYRPNYDITGLNNGTVLIRVKVTHDGYVQCYSPQTFSSSVGIHTELIWGRD